ncbi:MAG: hypothetical protein VXW15_02085 [Bdellovibrionota bacterium]|nr:hypothetical protein [Bdellovibrionota bacterium]|tara:strand:- start:312 stop:734 length:423 start_codon:yes stop_codon:yes gene_type:complete
MFKKEKARLKDHIISLFGELNSDIDKGVYGDENQARKNVLKFMMEISSYRVRCGNLSTEDAIRSGLEGLFNGIDASEGELEFSDLSEEEEKLLGNTQGVFQVFSHVFFDVISKRVDSNFIDGTKEDIKKIILDAVDKNLN